MGTASVEAMVGSEGVGVGLVNRADSRAEMSDWFC
jgi:hypothetical protein